MPNTKSAERRVRNSARKRLRNRSVKTRLKTLEKKFLAAATSGDKAQAGEAFKNVASALGKASKGGVIHRGTASRKESRLASKLAKLK
ncbi:MAG: 30S ribosomal protein S20 [Verrucomicrobia bacterium]|nr:30S ribosomal protein S20 [Verrucomicrobiota bacterium]